MDPETVLWFNTILLLALLVLAYLNTRRSKRMADKIDDLAQLVTDLQSKLADAQAKEAAFEEQQTAFQTQQTATSQALVTEVARVEAIIAGLQNNNDPRLDASINALGTLRDNINSLGESIAASTASVAASTVAEKSEQDQLDAERPDPAPVPPSEAPTV